MCSLQGFPAIPPDGEISLCEVEGRVHTASLDNSYLPAITNVTSNYPDINITHELLHPCTSREDGRQIFMPVDEPLLERFFQTCLEQGAMSALQMVSQSESAPVFLKIAASYLVKLIDTISTIQNSFYPHLRESGPELVSAVSATRGWLHSQIRCVAWHPHCTKLAVAALDDSIRVFSSDSTTTPILKRKEQRDISCLMWRPFSASELAVGCEVGVFVWQVDPNSVVSRPSIGCTTVLKRAGHSPVTSVAWSPQGDLLLSASAADSTMYVWDVAMESAVPLWRLGGGGVALVSWSPDTSKVFAATSSVVFRVWETRLWTPEHWTVMSGHVQAVCWSPCSSVVLFCTSEEQLVYSLVLRATETLAHASIEEATNTALPVIDLTQIEFSEDGEIVGGCVISMVWDSKGHYLAITFRNSSLVAVFRTEVKPLLQISPCCFVRGTSGEMPNFITFQQNFQDGAVLTIGWSSGRLQYFPIICSNLVTPSIHCLETSTSAEQSVHNIHRRTNNTSLWRI